LKPLEFINDSYARLDVTYHANGSLLAFVPCMRKLKLREVAGAKCLMGHLSERNDPARHEWLFRFPESVHTFRMTSRPYIEAFVGLENIFGILRVDYVWRITYRDNPYAYLGGVRVALKLGF
ncbi:MAG: carboxypeptidase-like regulatory domain-containing protein, partial [Duncaniella sp.]|nr:carboxypeptidase-like regulatory domain-containing protein [Duncaniella sp.]